jgi:hypothetical protein
LGTDVLLQELDSESISLLELENQANTQSLAGGLNSLHLSRHCRTLTVRHLDTLVFDEWAVFPETGWHDVCRDSERLRVPER